MGAADKTRPSLLCRSHKTPEPDQITTKSRLNCVARTYKRFLNSPVYIWGLGVILRWGCYSEGLAGCISSRLAGVITRRVEFRMVSCCRHIFRHTHKEQTLYQTAAIVIRAEPQRCDSDSQTCVWTFAAISCVSHVWHTHMERRSQRNRPPYNDLLNLTQDFGVNFSIQKLLESVEDEKLSL